MVWVGSINGNPVAAYKDPEKEDLMRATKAASILWIAAILYCTALMVWITFPYLSFKLNVDFLVTKQRIIHLKHWRYAFYAHILTSTFVLVAGAVQFWPYYLKHFKKGHRLIGKMYVYIILFISGPAGMIMSFYANGSWVAKSSFIILSTLWMLFTGLAFYYAVRRDFVKHRQFMIRSYALTLSAITLRLYALVLPHFVFLDGRTEYTLLAWTSWTINLAIAEIIIYSTRNKTVIV